MISYCVVRLWKQLNTPLQTSNGREQRFLSAYKLSKEVLKCGAVAVV